jgi:hypothetical protein
MTYGAITTAAPAVIERAAPGVVAFPLMPNEIIDRAVETAAGIAVGVGVTRGTDKAKQVVVGYAAGFLGFTCRLGDQYGPGGETNAINVPQYSQISLMRSGYLYLALTANDSGSPGDAINIVNATGVVGIGTAGGGETQLDGIELDEVVTSGMTYARFRLSTPRVAVVPITSIELNGVAVTPVAGVADLAVVESIIVAGQDAPAVGDITIAVAGSGIAIAETANTVTLTGS